MGRRTIAIILLVGGFLLLVVVFLVLQQNGGNGGNEAEVVTQETVPAGTPSAEEEAAPTVAEGTPGALVEVVVSLQTVPRGWQMTEAELTTDLRRAELVDDDMLTDIDQAVGMYARTDIFQGETLTRGSLVGDPTLVGAEEYGPSSLIPNGFLAQAIPMDRLSSVAYGVAAGDTVDVLITFYITEVDEEFTTMLQNSAAFGIETTTPAEEEGGAATVNRSLFVIDPFGRFETLPNGDLALITPSESQRPMRVSFLLQAAKVIQVGAYNPLALAGVPTLTPTPDPQATPTPEAGVPPTATPAPPDVVLLALAPQQQLVLKYAVENVADIDMALRGPGDGQIYSIENVDLPYFLQRFNIELPIDYPYTVNPVFVTVTPTPVATPAPEGGQ